ncbi:MAG: hypothetical protein GTO63_27135 [Anaerolineae bacterium]|nr:hypothetical protein [Anaerolineae bacterium]NIN98411.1 hypothetical protein [Anaerolineae bacterium]NIQ80728.1 hypothetical protein [Anaerolineae bacterium]
MSFGVILAQTPAAEEIGSVVLTIAALIIAAAHAKTLFQGWRKGGDKDECVTRAEFEALKLKVGDFVTRAEFRRLEGQLDTMTQDYKEMVKSVADVRVKIEEGRREGQAALSNAVQTITGQIAAAHKTK